MAVAYLVALGIFQLASVPLGTLLTYLFTAVAIVFVFFMVRKFIRNKGSACGECSSCNKTSSCDMTKYIKYKEDLRNDERSPQDE